jgi:glutamine amidotransferase
MITIVDYGVGNLASIKNMIKKTGNEAMIVSDEGAILNADKLILPGIGAFDHCMNQFNRSGMRPAVTKKALDEKVPLLGICVGLQMLGESSEEGSEPGLGWVKGKSVKFKKELLGDLKIPHMGWTEVQVKKKSQLMEGYSEDPRFYFVHSYHLQLDEMNDELLRAHYGYDFTAAIEKGNLSGVQFHPEKSHKFGMKLLENFCKYS